MALGEAPSGLVADQAVVLPDRHRQVEQGLQQAVDVGRRAQVLARVTRGDALFGVVQGDAR